MQFEHLTTSIEQQLTLSLARQFRSEMLIRASYMYVPVNFSSETETIGRTDAAIDTAKRDPKTSLPEGAQVVAPGIAPEGSQPSVRTLLYKSHEPNKVTNMYASNIETMLNPLAKPNDTALPREISHASKVAALKRSIMSSTALSERMVRMERTVELTTDPALA